MYIGGKEHTVLHLLYSRFVTMVLRDLGYFKEEEPYKRFFAHGLLIREGAKISKSKGNIVNPDEYIAKFGADSVRLYLMFLGDVRLGGDWRDSGMAGMARFVNRIWAIAQRIIKKGKKETKDSGTERAGQRVIKRVGDDLERLKFNTAIAFIMEYINSLYEFEIAKKEIGVDAIETLAKIISPFAPHLAEELWNQLGYKKSIFTESWPQYDPALVKEETIELVVQINGKVRGRFSVPAEISEEEAKKMALADENIKKWLGGKEPRKIIFVKGRLVNLVI
jgi:leucyl-tRNA synthetase